MSNPNLAGLQRGSVAVVGAAESDLGQMAAGTQPMDLMAQATMRALEDCGLTLKDVDGLFVADASVFPRMISANLNATVILVAERAAVALDLAWAPG